MEIPPTTRSTPCGACKYQRRKCGSDCVFAPYFPAENIQKFACVHHVFGCSNVGNILKSMRPEWRLSAVKTLAYQAEARVRDPVHGCTGLLSELEERHCKVKEDLLKAQTELAQYMSPEAMQELCPSFNGHSKGKSVAVEMPNPLETPCCIPPGHVDFETWDPFPPWGTFEKVGFHEMGGGAKNKNPSSIESGKGKSVAPPS